MQMRAPVRQNAPAIWMPVCTAGLLWAKIQIDTRMMVMSKLSLDYAFISA